MKYTIIFVIVFFCGKIFSQNSKSPDDFGVWESIYNGDISNDGKWMFYESRNQTQFDTLTVKAVLEKKQYKIPKGRWGDFTKDSRFFTVFTENSSLQIIDLKKDSTSYVNNCASRSFSFDESYLITTISKGKTPIMLVKNLLGDTEASIPYVTNFLINPSKNEVALVCENEKVFSVRVINLESNTITPVMESIGKHYKNLAWSANGRYLSFLETSSKDTENTARAYRCQGKKCQQLDLTSHPGSTGPLLVENNFLELSNKGDLVFFKARPKQDSGSGTEPEGVQIWDTADKWIYPMKKVNNLLSPQPTIWSWSVNEKIIKPVTDTTLTEEIKVNNDLILKYDKLAYEPQYKYIADVDMYLHNLKTGKSTLLLEKIKPNEVFISPTGEAIVFFKNENWWVYDLSSQKFKNLTKDLPGSFMDKNNDREDKRIPFSKRIKWVKGKEAILVCDKYDVWKLGLHGKDKQRLTDGREQKRKYRLFIDYLNPKGINQNTVNSEKGFLVHGVDENRNSGYFLWQANDSLTEITFGAFKVDGIKWDTNMQYFTYRVQAYDMPPKIVYYNRNKGTHIQMAQSNKGRGIDQWGRPELLEFTTKKGKPSKAFLIHPVDYDPSKKYPMIVKVYEKQTERMHDFYPISWYGSDGFNPTHYALDGYFVLLPDISFEIGNPGLSAYQYTKESVEYALEKASIDKDKIGLYGFSFGGYESAFIVTRTNRYAAAVAGAAVTNLITFYHTINWLTGQEEMFRLENYQMRMGGSYFNRKERYINNSPFHNIENISTPLLLWSGGNDLHINYHESIRFYLALRRLNKKGKLLLFENEGHNILDLDKRKYLTTSIKDWFDLYCK